MDCETCPFARGSWCTLPHCIDEDGAEVDYDDSEFEEEREREIFGKELDK